MLQQAENRQIVSLLSDRRSNPYIRSRKRKNFDRRRSYRAGFGSMAFLTGDGMMLDGRLENISDSGACISVSMPENEKLEFFEIGIPVLRSEAIVCETAWQNRLNGNGIVSCGVRFVGLSNEDRALLRKRILLDQNILLSFADEIAAKVADRDLQRDIQSFFIIDIRIALERLIDGDTALARTAGPEEIQDHCSQALDELAEAGDRLDTALQDQAVIKQIKARVRSLLGHFLYQSRVFRRAFEKPRGYPGDYDMLEMAYNNRVVSSGIGGLLDRYGLDLPYSEAIRLRKDMMHDILRSYIGSRTCSDLRILNLASGPCREIRELLASPLRCPARVELTCIDLDDEAISYSQERLSEFDSGPMTIKFIQGNILKLEELDIGPDSSLDMIYSIGIADYLQDRMLRKIFSDAYRKLKTGGRLVIAYKDRERNKPLPFNWYGDWNFVPRNQKELLDLVYASMGKENIEICITREKTGIIFFADITKVR